MEYRGMQNDESQSCWHLGKSWARIYMWMEWLHYVFILDKQAVVHKDLDLMEDVQARNTDLRVFRTYVVAEGLRGRENTVRKAQDQEQSSEDH